jgi:DNA phosphorothioation-associated putative methyltransferase
MRRHDLSVPAQHLVNMELLGPAESYLDYGCGRGDDVEELRRRGFVARGWDPVHFPKTRKSRASIVGCHYVINVIDRPGERVEVVESAWRLTKRMLLVSARLVHEQDEAHVVPKGDGWLTPRGTFQKFYTHEELGELLASVTRITADPVAPGLYAVFRDESLRQEWKAKRMRRPSSPRLKTISSRKLEAHREALEPMMRFVLRRGRLPQGDELAEFAPAIEVFGSARQAFQVVVQATDREAWKRSAIERAVDLLGYLALAQFDEVDRMGKLTPALQRDVRAHFGSFKAAHDKASKLLFSSGRPEAVNFACRASRVGKLTPTALYVHESALGQVPALLRVVFGCAQRLVGDIPEANVIKFFRSAPMISFLEYPEFGPNPHPWLQRAWHLDLQSQRLQTLSFGGRSNRPILHRLHEFVGSAHPQFEEWRQLTEREVAAGYFADPSSIGTEAGWMASMARAGGSQSG